MAKFYWPTETEIACPRNDNVVIKSSPTPNQTRPYGKRMLGAARLCLAAAALFPTTLGVWLELPQSGTKCVSESLHTNAVVLAAYYAFFGEDYHVNTTVVPDISVKVTSPFGNTLHHQENVYYGQFSFTTTEVGNYLACFTASGDNGGKKTKTITIGIDWKTGIAAKDWDVVARKEKIEGLELELRKLGESVNMIYQNLYRLMEKDMEMSKISDNTNTSVAHYSMFSLGVCIVASLVQVLYLRRYFRKKMLI